MTGRLHLPLILLLLLSASCARAVPEPCLSGGAKDTPEVNLVWRLICEQFLRRIEGDPAVVDNAGSYAGSDDRAADRREGRNQKDEVVVNDGGTWKGHKENNEGARSQVPVYAMKVPQGTNTAQQGRNPTANQKLWQAVDSVSPPTDSTTAQETKSSDGGGNSRQHKAFFVNYPASQRVYQNKPSTKPGANGTRKKQKQKQKQKPQKSGIKQQHQKPESEIYFIRLPPTPYSYVPGLGYISQPPSFSAASLAAVAPPPTPPPAISHHKRPPVHKQKQPPAAAANPFIKLPIDFVSNGKPTSVYRWPPPPTKDHHHKNQTNSNNKHKYPGKNKPDSTIIKLNRGPYVFDGRPTSVYVMKRNPRPPFPNRY